MPYWGDPDFPLDLDDNQKVWRYINFEKYVDLLERKKQYFANGKKLQDIDQNEGYFKKPDLWHPDKWSQEEKQIVKQIDKKQRYEDPKSVFINCWHINESESATMWQLYSKTDSGIVIQTTIKKLKASFHDYTQRVDIRKVEYVNNKRSISVSLIPWRFSKKGRGFSDENELRIFVVGASNMIRAVISEDGRALGSEVIPEDQRPLIDRNDDGMWIPVDLDYFIETIYVSKLSQRYFLDMVKDITKKHGLDSNMVKKSSIL